MASTGGYDIGFDVSISSATVTPELFTSPLDDVEYLHCAKCNYGGCDVRVTLCGCTFHTVCRAFSDNYFLLLFLAATCVIIVQKLRFCFEFHNLNVIFPIFECHSAVYR
jgi:hypothetical protein